MKRTSAKSKILAGLGAAAVAVAAPMGVLLAGAGSAQADDVCTPYDQGYTDGVFGGVGKCFVDGSKQPSYDSGFADGRAGRPSNPPNPWPSISLLPNPGDTPQTSMSPWDGRTGSWPEPPEFPEYDLPPEPYSPSEQPLFESPAVD